MSYFIRFSVPSQILPILLSLSEFPCCAELTPHYCNTYFHSVSFLFIFLTCRFVNQQYVGESERQVRQVFDRAASNTPCVIFFDELEALGQHRQSSDVVRTLTLIFQDETLRFSNSVFNLTWNWRTMRSANESLKFSINFYWFSITAAQRVTCCLTTLQQLKVISARMG